MSKYSSKAILNWFHRSLGVDGRPKYDEVLSTCPECGSDRFYFNLIKRVGVCHKASCGFTPTLDKLIRIVGFPPDEDGVFESEVAEKELEPLSLPGWPVAMMTEGQLMTSNVEALEYLRNRGLSDSTIVNWGLTCDNQRVYVPIYSNGVLVNYNSRLLPGLEGKKYLYAKGRHTGRYILGWEECLDWHRLSLVENTLVSLWLRSELHCSTTFGSNVSDLQSDLIGKSRIRSVAILWDEGAEQKAEKATRKLKDKGIKAAYFKILGQPDDYSKEQIIKWTEAVFKAAENGVPYVDLRGECATKIES